MREGRTKNCGAGVDLAAESCWELFMWSENVRISASVRPKLQGNAG